MHTFRFSTLLTLSVVLALSACQKNNDSARKSMDSQAAASQEFVRETQASKPDGTVGMLLPDFTQLVAREGSSVVNIQAVNDAKESELSAESDPFSEFFKRFNNPDDESSNNNGNFGSGVIISADGYVITNAHVIKGMTEIKVALNDKREYPAKLIGSDEKSDIALLKIEASDLPVAKIGSPSELKSGEWVAAIGAPFGFDNSVTAGIVSAKNRTLPNENYMPFIQTDVAINPGNSGGPLFNLKGQVVGINSQIYSRSGGFMGISFAIPIDVAMNVVDQLKSTGKVERGQLGVVIQELSYDLAKSFGLDKPAGALVAKVSPNSPAEKAGLEVGDIIRSVNGEAVRSSSDLPMTISAIRPGDEVKLGIWRKGETLEIIAKLISQSEQQSAQIEPEESYRSDRVTAFTFPAAGLTISVRTNNSDEPELVISRVQGIAAKLGLRRGDVIVRVGEQAVRSQEEFDAAVRQAGNQIPLLINRAGDAFFTVLNVE
ncbi:DegQ family serine endoprotease [Kingella kingae]|uniref:DegQ family serine endoprotease n=1 Tax=Kingella kingae TaxID=504 RepID=UPI0004045275|nr:DegQ family serine endoprotease [Kingella kingae]MDK4525394.1 DegQ family serine endoprotease [Kingella kingae]MDK4531381.1 DegQ family serine endoprotease [Kingella kingae]